MLVKLLINAFWTTMSIDHVKQTRSHAGNAYYDPVFSRKNLMLLTRQKVNEILFSDTKPIGVQFVSRADNFVTKVYAKCEAFLGAIFNPRLF